MDQELWLYRPGLAIFRRWGIKEDSGDWRGRGGALGGDGGTIVVGGGGSKKLCRRGS